jgi:hypothetical protein
MVAHPAVLTSVIRFVSLFDIGATMHGLNRLACIVGRGWLLVLAITGPAKAASVQQSEVVPMQRFEVKQDRGYFDFKLRYDDETERVQEVNLTWVSPAAYKRSLRVGDGLRSIDGTVLTELPYRELLARMKRDLKPGETRTLVFTRTGLFGRRTITHTTTGPNAAPASAPRQG